MLLLIILLIIKLLLFIVSVFKLIISPSTTNKLSADKLSTLPFLTAKFDILAFSIVVLVTSKLPLLKLGTSNKVLIFILSVSKLLTFKIFPLASLKLCKFMVAKLAYKF